MRENYINIVKVSEKMETADELRGITGVIPDELWGIAWGFNPKIGVLYL